MALTEFKVDGDCVIDADGGIVYDGLDSRAAGIIAELLTQRSTLEEKPAAPQRPEAVTEEMLLAAMREAVRVGLLPKWAHTDTYVKQWDGMKAVLRAALNA